MCLVQNGYKAPPQPPFGIFNEAYAPFHEGPEISIPLSQVPYNSTITNHVEYLPVSVAIMARPGCDYVLLDLAAGLQVRTTSSVLRSCARAHRAVFCRMPESYLPPKQDP